MAKLTMEEFGESIKKKHPQYKDIDNVQLGKKMLEKYPQYKSKVIEAPASVAFGAPKKVTPDLSPRAQEPSAFKQALGTVATGAGATAGGLGALALAGGALKKVGKSIYTANLPPSTDEARAIQARKAGISKAKPVLATDVAIDLPTVHKGGRTLTSKLGGFGTRSVIGDQTQAAAANIFKDKINPIFEQANKNKVSFNFKDLKTEAIKNIQKSSMYSNELKKDIVEDVTALFEGMKGKTGLKNLDQLKKEIVKKIPKKYLKTGAGPTPYSLQGARDAVSGVFRSKVHDTIKSKFGVDSAKLYGDYSALKGLSEVGVKAKTQAGRKGGSGTLVSYISDTLATPVTTAVGKGTYKAGKMLQYIPKEALKALKASGKVLKTVGKGMLVVDPVATPELLQYVPGTIGRSFKEFIRTNPASIAFSRLMEMGQSKEEVIESMVEEFGVTKEEAEDILTGKVLIV